MAEPDGVWLTRTPVTDAGSAAGTGLAPVLDDLDRRARRGHAPGRSVRESLTWDRADRRDREWWPQGLSTSADAELDGPGSETAYGRRVAVVTWYSKRRPGTRITLLDLDARSYAHVLLVVPGVVDGVPGLSPLKVHAGGLLWRGSWLHVAATGRGLVSAHLDDLIAMPTAPDPRLGDFAAEFRHLLPVRLTYAAGADPGVERLRYSFLSLGRSGPEPALLAGEYARSTGTKRLARYSLADDGLLTVDPSGVARPTSVVDSGVGQAQGAVWTGDRYHFSTTVGTVHAGLPGATSGRRLATPPGPEDLSWWPSTGRIWTVTEVPWLRWVIAMAPSGSSEL